MIDSWHKPWPLGGLLFGLFMVLLAVIATFTGKTYGRGGSADRSKEPLTYWLTLAIQYLGGAYLIWWFYPMLH
ncbi:MAG TPA: hypothetical protein VH350_13475 [Candidatus Sulfotelmatobacter sp.]|nr:hypothetical protein [Candidatus Sulfotelmatobacter sp.]